MRNRFDNQLAALHDELIAMGVLCENAIASAVKALLTGDLRLAHRAVELEREIDHQEREIERMCLKLLLQQQPVASDLRLISSALKMITDMERIGDQAADIADITQSMPHCMGNNPHIESMARIAIEMVTDSVDAFVRRDLALARRVIERDDEVDALFDQSRQDLIARITGSPAGGEQIIDVLMISKYLERIGDHATNIAEWVEFSITGTHEE